jgi:hypothetical protein
MNKDNEGKKAVHESAGRMRGEPALRKTIFVSGAVN